MDKDWIVGSRKQIRGAVKQVVDKAIGDDFSPVSTSSIRFRHVISGLSLVSLSHTWLDRAGGSYDRGAAQYGGRDKLVTTEIKRCLPGTRRYSSLLGIIDHIS